MVDVVRRGRSAHTAQVDVRVYVWRDVRARGSKQRHVELNHERLARILIRQPAGYEIAQENSGVGVNGAGAQGFHLVRIQVGKGGARV